jgi:hypothetical protein
VACTASSRPCSTPLLCAFSRFPLLRQIARKRLPCLRQFALARGQRRLDPREFRRQRLSLRVAFGLGPVPIP